VAMQVINRYYDHASPKKTGQAAADACTVDVNQPDVSEA